MADSGTSPNTAELSTKNIDEITNDDSSLTSKSTVIPRKKKVSIGGRRYRT